MFGRRREGRGSLSWVGGRKKGAKGGEEGGKKEDVEMGAMGLGPRKGTGSAGARGGFF